ncbi:MAG: hypothetical protein DWQ31_08065 [Planctomycetota bacterium]|nr:MAG: hypothetical protein DWQ31_08065 [Planctomycetota bacterium]REJ88706.1 MAG: hypothetical protein DWQ35_19390 [Planctomycetota bacterium]REK23511.1 MAG: hypothetical protein DWQ42_15215 [Planctomycetota bacterium]REK40432.1 MAG: hypothetical protein DWQ46_16560 [Planctomycetota bacterium]
MLVFLLMGTVLVMVRVSSPEFWATALTALGMDEQAATEVDDRPTPPEEKEPEEKEYVPYYPDLPQEKSDDEIEILSPYERQQSVEGRNRLPGVDLQYLARVEDNRPRHSSERAAWLNLFELLLDNDPEFLERAARNDVGYVQLFRQPAEYRGQLVTLQGEARRVEELPFGKNELGIEKYYKLYLKVPSGFQRFRLVFVYVLELPDAFPQKFDMRQEVEVTGFSFKKVPYARADGATEVAPVLLARSIRWEPEVEETIDPLHVAWTTGGILALVLTVTWFYYRSSRRKIATNDAAAGSLGADAVLRFSEEVDQRREASPFPEPRMGRPPDESD